MFAYLSAVSYVLGDDATTRDVVLEFYRDIDNLEMELTGARVARANQRVVHVDFGLVMVLSCFSRFFHFLLIYLLCSEKECCQWLGGCFVVLMRF